MTAVIPSERSEPRVIPSERSESRDRHLGFLTESTESAELGARIFPPYQQHPLGLWMNRRCAQVRPSRPGKQLSVLSVLSVRNTAAEVTA
jgi:hypothetical protein